MKIKGLTLLLLIALICGSCDKNNAPLFQMEMFFELDIPAGLNTIESHFFLIQDVPTFAEALLTGNGMSPEDVGRINGLTANMTTRFSGLDLDFIENVGVFVVNGNNFEDRDEAFYIFNDFVDFGSKTEIQMIPGLLDFKDQLLEETVDLELRINLRGFLPSELDTRVTLTFDVYAPE